MRSVSGGDTFDPKYGVSSSPRLASGSNVPKGGGTYKLGVPYKIGERWYIPREEPGYDRTGIGSWYGDDFHGRKTANGELFDMHALTAAHPTLPMPSYAYVTNLDNGRTILVRVNDRGPYANDRVIDLSHASARVLGYENRGTARVRVRYAGRAPLNGDDRRERQYLAAQSWYGAGGASVASYVPPNAPMSPPEPFPAGTAGRWSPANYRATLAGKAPPAEPAPGRLAAATAEMGEEGAGSAASPWSAGAYRARLSGKTPPAVEAQARPTVTTAAAPSGTEPGGLVWRASPRPPARNGDGWEPPETASLAGESKSLGSGRTYVQVGVFPERGAAERWQRELAGLGPVEIAPVPGGGRAGAYRVRIGPLNPAEARTALNEVQARGASQGRLASE